MQPCKEEEVRSQEPEVRRKATKRDVQHAGTSDVPFHPVAAALGAHERACLLALAREAIHKQPLAGVPEPTGRLGQPGSVFVTLRIGTHLRGCIGQLGRRSPLYQAVIDAARCAALDDPRFPPLSESELESTHIEISVLSEPQEMPPASLPGSIVLGQDGLLVVQGERRGLLLPQVPGEWGWNEVEFLSQTCVKAGLPPFAWRTSATIYRFTAEVFGEDQERAGYCSST